jgi:hypothetical protein
MLNGRAPGSRSLRLLAYRLKDVEDALRAAKFPEAADELARAAKLQGVSPDEEFLDEARLLLVNSLLGDREMPQDLIGEIMDVIALVDQVLMNDSGSGESR